MAVYDIDEYLDSPLQEGHRLEVRIALLDETSNYSEFLEGLEIVESVRITTAYLAAVIDDGDEEESWGQFAHCTYLGCEVSDLKLKEGQTVPVKYIEEGGYDPSFVEDEDDAIHCLCGYIGDKVDESCEATSIRITEINGPLLLETGTGGGYFDWLWEEFQEEWGGEGDLRYFRETIEDKTLDEIRGNGFLYNEIPVHNRIKAVLSHLPEGIRLRVESWLWGDGYRLGDGYLWHNENIVGILLVNPETGEAFLDETPPYPESVARWAFNNTYGMLGFDRSGNPIDRAALVEMFQ